MEAAASKTNNDPFLFRFATVRTGQGTDLPGRYCEKRALHVVDEENGSRAIVDGEVGLLSQTHTKTMTQVEADDHDQDRGALAETSTMTKVRQEADDEDASLQLFETQTKTSVQQESDDQRNAVI